MFTKTLLTVALLAGIGVSLAGDASAQEATGPTCGTFAVIAKIDTWHAVDHGDEGESPGDVRLLRVNLLDHDGEEIGESYTVVTLLPSPEDGPQMVRSDSHHMFANGALAISTVTQTPNTNTDVKELTHTLQRPVVGGTGDFAHATGTVTTATLPDGSREMTYELRCGG